MLSAGFLARGSPAAPILLTLSRNGMLRRASPFTVTGSLGIFTRFPFTFPGANAGSALKTYDSYNYK